MNLSNKTLKFGLLNFLNILTLGSLASCCGNGMVFQISWWLPLALQNHWIWSCKSCKVRVKTWKQSA